MAEIRIERKQRSSMLPWILGLVLLALVILALASMMGRDDGRRTRERGAAAAENTWDTPPHLRQYAAVSGTALELAA